MFGTFTWVVQILVALSALGSLHSCIFGASRVFFVGARNGHLPKALALIHLEKLTPAPAIMFIVKTSLHNFSDVCKIFFLEIGILGRSDNPYAHRQRRLCSHKLY